MPISSKPLLRQHTEGFSLIETVIFIVIIGIALITITTQFNQNVGHSAEPLLRQRGVTIANSYLDEIVRKRWDENSPIGGGCVATLSATCTATESVSATLGAEGGESRASYDDVDDYNGLNDSPPQEATGTPLTDLSGYRITVSVAYPAADWNGISRYDIKVITLTVTSTLGESLEFKLYRVNY